MNMLKVLKFKRGVTTAGDTWNDSAYDTIETPSELTYEFDGCNSRFSEIRATKEDLIAKAIKVESWNTWFYEMEGEYKTFQEVGLESPMVFVPEEDNELPVEEIGDFINNCKGYCSKSFYEEVKEQLLEIALNAVEITVMDENGEDITSQFSSQRSDKMSMRIYFNDGDYEIDNTIQFIIEIIEKKINQLSEENEELKQRNEFLKKRCDEYWKELGLNNDYLNEEEL